MTAMILLWLGRAAAWAALAASLQAPGPGRIALPDAPLAAGPSAEAQAGLPAAPALESAAASPAAAAPPAPSAAEAAQPAAAVAAPEAPDDAGRGPFDCASVVDRPRFEAVYAARERSRRVLARYFPALYRDVETRYALLPADGVEDTKSWSDGSGHHIDWYQAPGPLAAPQARVATPFDGPPLAKRVVDLMVHLHEYAHLLFNEALGLPAVKPSFPVTARETLTEGFALTLELESVDRLVADASAWKLTPRDVEDLRSWRKQRLASLRRPNHYSEGFFSFARPLFKKDGEAGLARLLAGLDQSLLMRLASRGTFLSLIGRDPAVFEPVLTRPAREQPALMGMAAILSGSTPTPEQARAASALIGAANPASLRRALRPYLTPPSDDPSELARRPQQQLSPAFRMAAHSIRAARALAELATEAASRPEFRDALARHPLWAEAIFSGVVTLPLDAAQRAAWRAVLMRWVPTVHDHGHEGWRVAAHAGEWLSVLER